MICSETEARQKIARNIALARERPAIALVLAAHRTQAGSAKSRADRLLDPQCFLRATPEREPFILHQPNVMIGERLVEVIEPFRPRSRDEHDRGAALLGVKRERTLDIR